jgi:radical SAM superfamily enzyme YgiQ (UPF0313 family)
MQLPPDQILIRPPIEAHSVLIPVTGGCSWNHCRFCGIYKEVQPYAIRDLQSVIRDIEWASKRYGDHPYVYLAGGNPTSASTDFLVKIIRCVKQNFKSVKRISCYAKCLDIVRKTDEELKQLAEAGLTIVYMGMESGSDTVLSYMKKGNNARTLVSAVTRLIKAGIEVSLYIILGLGGEKWTDIHATETARVLNLMNPTYFRFRTLNVMDSSPLRKDIDEGTFKILSPLKILLEERKIISDLDVSLTSKLRNDHVSNYSYVESGSIGQDKARVLKILDEIINDPDTAKWRHKGLKSM